VREWSKEKEEENIKISEESPKRQHVETPQSEQVVEPEGERYRVSPNQLDGTVLFDKEETVEAEDDGPKELDRGYESNLSVVYQIKDEQKIIKQQHIEMTTVENTMKSKNNTGEDSKNPKELDRRNETNVSVVHKDEDEQEIKDNPVSPNQQGKEIDFEIPIDDMSPITLCALLSDFVKTLPLIHMNFDFRLLLLFFVSFPIVVHIKLAVIFFYELEFYHEVYRKFNYSVSDNLNLAESEFSFQSIASENWRSIVAEQIGIGINAAVYCSLFVILTLVRPKDLLCRLRGRRDRRAFGLLIFGASIPNRSVSLGEIIIHNLTIQRPQVCELASFLLELYMAELKKCLMKLTLRRSRGTRLKRALRSWCVTLCFFPGFLIATAFGIAFLLIFLIIFVSLLIVTSPLFCCLS